MRIVHVIEATAAGTLSMVSLLANEQSAMHADVSVVYSLRPDSPDDFLSHFAPRIRLFQIQMNSTQERLMAVGKLRAFLKSEDTLAIFLHSSIAGFLGRISLLRLHYRNVFYIPHCVSMMREDITRGQRIIFTLLEWIANITPATYIACSASEFRVLKRYIPLANHVLIENASPMVRTGSIDVQISNSSERLKKIVCVGRIRPQKDPLRFAKIVRIVLDKQPDVQFFWIGDGDPQVREGLISAGIIVTGWIPHDEVVAHLNNSLVYLSTSLWEGLPVSVIEAMAMRLVPVVSDCAGNSDIVSHGKTGYVFNTAQLASEEIIHILNNRLSASLIADRAYEECLERFSVTRYVTQMNSLIKQ